MAAPPPRNGVASAAAACAAPAQRMQVAVRVRPRPDEGSGRVHTLQVEDNVVRQGAKDFAFDSVFTGNQESIYDACGRPMVHDAVHGYNTCLFAYGQTGSGKSYTLMGVPGAGLPAHAPQTPEDHGILPRFLADLCAYRQAKLQKYPSMQITMTMSVLEIYNEEVRDLLRTNTAKEYDAEGVPVRDKPVMLVEDPETKQGVVVMGAVEAQVDGSDHAMQLLNRGVQARETAATGMNELSSRSHMVVILTFKQLQPATQAVFVSNVKFVDLAGSECLSRTGVEGQRRREGSYINKSLLALGKALNSFSTGVPMQDMKGMLRESKLTRLLSENFGGNSKTLYAGLFFFSFFLLLCLYPPPPRARTYTTTSGCSQWSLPARPTRPRPHPLFPTPCVPGPSSFTRHRTSSRRPRCPRYYIACFVFDSFLFAFFDNSPSFPPPPPTRGTPQAPPEYSDST